MSVCESVLPIAFETLKLGPSFSVRTYIFTISGSISVPKLLDQGQGQMHSTLFHLLESEGHLKVKVI